MENNEQTTQKYKFCSYWQTPLVHSTIKYKRHFKLVFALFLALRNAKQAQNDTSKHQYQNKLKKI